MGTLNLVLSLFGWTIVPDLATKRLLNLIYHRVNFVAPPQPGSLRHRKHYALTYAFVICAYLIYTLVQSARSMSPNFYEILGVPSDVDENGLKLAFRAFAKRYHPDRPGIGKDGEALFMYVRDAFEALKDPTVRFAYDRFGPAAVDWRQHCTTPREFLRRGLMMASGYHIVAGIALLFWSAIGRPSSVSFWRYVLFAALLAAELSFILSPFPSASSSISPSKPTFFPFPSPSSSVTNALSLLHFPTVSFLQRIFPQRIPYQHILFLHQLFMFLSVALSRVVPQFLVLLGPGGDPNAKQLDPVERAIWERVYGSLAIADREASLILHTILWSITPLTSTDKPYHEPTLARMQPLPPDKTAAALDKLTPDMQKLITETNIKIQRAGPVATAWDAALRQAYARRSDSEGRASNQLQSHKPRIKNFWEKEAADSTDDTVTLVDSDIGLLPSSSRPANPDKLNRTRTPSTPRSGPRAGFGEGSGGVEILGRAQSNSPVRRASFGPGTGEI